MANKQYNKLNTEEFGLDNKPYTTARKAYEFSLPAVIVPVRDVSEMINYANKHKKLEDEINKSSAITFASEELCKQYGKTHKNYNMDFIVANAGITQRLASNSKADQIKQALKKKLCL